MNTKLCGLLLCMSSVVFAGSNSTWSSHVCPNIETLQTYQFPQNAHQTEDILINGLRYDAYWRQSNQEELVRKWSAGDVQRVIRNITEFQYASLNPGKQISCLYQYKSYDTKKTVKLSVTSNTKCKVPTAAQSPGSLWVEASTGYFPGLLFVCTNVEGSTARCPFQCK